MSNPTNPPPTAQPKAAPVPVVAPPATGTRLEELEKQLIDAERRIMEARATFAEQLAHIHRAEEDFNSKQNQALAISNPRAWEINRQGIETMRQRLRDIEGAIRDAQADRDNTEIRIRRLHEAQETRLIQEQARRSQRTSFVVSVLSLLVAALGVAVGQCSKPPQDVKVICVPGASGPAAPSP